MVAAGKVEGTAEAALPSLFGGLKGQAKSSEVLALYRVLLLHYLEDLKITDEQSKSLAQLRALLNLSEAESISVYQAAAGPLFRSAVQTAVASESLGDAAKAELESALSDLALPAEVTKTITSDVYTEKLQAFTADGAIMNEEQAEELAKLRAFLSLEMDDVYDAHEEMCSGAYRNSVREVMGSSGIIPDEYYEGLEALRSRVGLSEEAAQALFAVEVTAKLKEFGTKAVAAMEAKAEQQQKADDGQGSLGMDASAIATQCLNLVDFAVAAKALVTKEAAGKEFEVCGANLREEFELTILKQLYNSYLVEAFSGSDSAANQRLFDNLNRLALVLGLSEEEMTAINNSVGGQIYRNYISKALRKGPLGQEETNFLGAIKDTLNMEQAKCDQLIREQQLNRVSFMLEAMFEKSNVKADDVREVRDQADLYDIDLVDDLDVPMTKLEKLFQCELEDLVDTGELKPDDMSALIELCEPLHVSEDSAQRMLEETVQKRVSGGVLGAHASLLQDNAKLGFSELERVLKFAVLIPDIVAETKAVSQGERSELFMLFQAGQLSAKSDPAESAAKLEQLKSVLGLAAAVQA